jgi:hypothetical protein
MRPRHDRWPGHGCERPLRADRVLGDGVALVIRHVSDACDGACGVWVSSAENASPPPQVASTAVDTRTITDAPNNLILIMKCLLEIECFLLKAIKENAEQILEN